MHEIDFKRLSGSSKLFLDFTLHDGSACELFGGDFRKLETFRKTAEQLDKYSFERSKVASIIGDATSSFNLSEKTRRNIERLKAPGSLCVFTGQQTGLLLGPMYTVLKALTTYKLARKLEKELARPVVPCFWMATDDHDFAEIKSASLLNRDGGSMKITYEPVEMKIGPPIAELNFDSSITRFADSVAENLIDTEFKTNIVDSLHRIYAPGVSISKSFMELFEQIMGQFGIVPVDPNFPGLKSLFQPVFQREIDSHDEIFEIFENRSRLIVEKGYHRQVHKSRESLNLFYSAGVRRNIIHTRDNYHLDGLTESYTKSDLAKLLSSNPEKFSPNVALRPIAQCSAFPVIAQIVGPSEAAYFAQIKPLYDYHRVPWPVIFPRQFASMIEPHIAKILRKLSIDFAGLANDREFEIGRVINANFQSETLNQAENIKDEIETRLSGFAEPLKVSDLESYQAIDHVRRKVDHELNTLAKKLFQAHKKKNDEARQRIQKAANFLLPDGNYQERVISPIYFINKFGPGIIDWLESKLDIESTGHQMLEIDI
jgi:bacillithiol synthase